MVTRHASAGRAARRQFAVLVILLGLALLAPATSSAHTRAIENPIGIHSMLFLDHPFSAKQAMFKEAAATGASEIRLDIELSGVFPDPNAPPDWSGVDQYMSLARRYHLRVLADLLATPSYLTSCPSGTPAGQTYLCPPRNPALWGEEAGAIAAHTRGVINDFEIINEPDGSWAFRGTPQQYAAILTASYQAIHNANPNDRVALGGLMNIGPGGRNWMNEMLDKPRPQRHPLLRHRQHPRPNPSRPNREHNHPLAAVLHQQTLHRPPMGDRNRLTRRPNPTNRPRIPRRPRSPSPLPQRDHPDNDPRRRRQDLHHRARLPHRPLRLRRNPQHHRSTNRRPALHPPPQLLHHPPTRPPRMAQRTITRRAHPYDNTSSPETATATTSPTTSTQWHHRPRRDSPCEAATPSVRHERTRRTPNATKTGRSPREPKLVTVRIYTFSVRRGSASPTATPARWTPGF